MESNMAHKHCYLGVYDGHMFTLINGEVNDRSMAA